MKSIRESLLTFTVKMFAFTLQCCLFQYLLILYEYFERKQLHYLAAQSSALKVLLMKS